MRDIRGDLQDRASFLEEQISAAQAQFEKRLGQLKHEHQAKIDDLQAELEAVTTLMDGEYRRLSDEAPVHQERQHVAPQAGPERGRRPEPEPQRRPAPEPEPFRHPVAEAEPQRPQAPQQEQYRRPAPEPETYRRPVAQEPQRRPAPEPENYRRPVAEEPQRRPAPEPEYQDRRPAPEQEPYRRPVAEEPQRRPMSVHEAEPDYRAAPPQVYRRAQAAPEPEQRRQAPVQAQQPQQPPLADFLIRKLGEIGAMSIDELCHLAVQEGYAPDGGNADRGVHVTLMNVAKAGFIRQLPNGTFAPATVMDTIRLRRAI
jgi:hypothetical protein